MRYRALACDYDGTIAHHGRVDDKTLNALQRMRASGRKLLLVTGRQLDDLMSVFPEVQLFDRVVAENGALLYDPTTRTEQMIADAPPPEFARELQRRGVDPVAQGRVIVATWEPHDATVFQVIHDMQLELQVIFNKGAVMVLPSGINKAVGLKRSLETLKLSLHNTVGVGDAENDHAFLTACECSVAVANALDSIKSRVDLVTEGHHGAGVIELINGMLSNDLADLNVRLTRHDLLIGQGEPASSEIKLPAYDGGVLIAGPSGAGKTTVTTALLERLCECEYQFAVIDPEGDYHDFPNAIALHGTDARALVDETLQVLDRPTQNVVVTLIDLRLEDRPAFLQMLLPLLLQLRANTGRPHWIVIDEAHHLLPSTWESTEATLPAELKNFVMVTIHPDHVAPTMLRLVETMIAVGRDAQTTINEFTTARGVSPIKLPQQKKADAALSWFVRLGQQPILLRGAKPVTERLRHRRKYAEGELPEDRSFFFRGPEGKLNLRAQNLATFLQLADGVDDDTWRFHLQERDVSRWFKTKIKDSELAADAAEVEREKDLEPNESRARIREAVERRYTVPP